jgi:hypothetical protein
MSEIMNQIMAWYQKQVDERKAFDFGNLPVIRDCRNGKIYYKVKGIVWIQL